jgi:uncharacterized protein (TIGR02266 family)
MKEGHAMTGTPMLRAAHRYPTALKVAFVHSKGTVPGDALNISMGGLFVRTAARVPQGTVVQLAVEFPDGEPPAPARARVVHAATRARDPGFGMEFVEDREGLGARVHRHIESILGEGNVTALRLLTAARELLHANGWVQLTEHDGSRGYCLSGALLRAAGEDRRAYQTALRAVGSRLGLAACPHGGFDCHCSVIRWNDAEFRTHQQVIAKVDEVIDAELRSGSRSPSA